MYIMMSDSEVGNGNMVCLTLATHYYPFDNVVNPKANYINYRHVSDAEESNA